MNYYRLDNGRNWPQQDPILIDCNGELLKIDRQSAIFIIFSNIILIFSDLRYILCYIEYF